MYKHHKILIKRVHYYLKELLFELNFKDGYILQVKKLD